MKSLPDFLSQSIDDVVQLQQLFDQAYEIELLRLKPCLEELPDIDLDLFTGLIPARMLVDQYQLKCRLQMEQDRSQAFLFKVQPIPLKLEILVGEKSIQHQNIEIAVQQVTLNSNPFSNT